MTRRCGGRRDGCKRGALAALLLLTGVLGSSARADALSHVTVDPDASKVDFELKATLHTVHGHFRIREGRIDFDPDSGEAHGRVVVDARSGETGSRSRDENMHRDVLESERYPEIVFLPQHVAILDRSDDEARAELSGIVEIHGVREPLVIPAAVWRESGGIHIDASFSVPYVQWGLADPSVFILRVAPEVTVHLDVAAALEEPPLPSPVE